MTSSPWTPGLHVFIPFPRDQRRAVVTQVLQMRSRETEVCGSSYIAHGPQFAKKDVDLVGGAGSLNQILLMLFCSCLDRSLARTEACIATGREQLSTPSLA